MNQIKIWLVLVIIIAFSEVVSAERFEDSCCRLQIQFLEKLQKDHRFRVCLNFKPFEYLPMLLSDNTTVAGFDPECLSDLKLKRGIRCSPSSWRIFSGKIIDLHIAESDPKSFWQKFRRKYPGYAGVASLSLPAVSKTRKKCVFYYHLSFNQLNGYGILIQLKKGHNSWKVERQVVLDLT